MTSAPLNHLILIGFFVDVSVIAVRMREVVSVVSVMVGEDIVVSSRMTASIRTDKNTKSGIPSAGFNCHIDPIFPVSQGILPFRGAGVPVKLIGSVGGHSRSNKIPKNFSHFKNPEPKI
jgi:hypothetical protein